MNLFKTKKSMLFCSIGIFIFASLYLLGFYKEGAILAAIILLIGNIVLSIVHCKTENATELINATLVSRLGVAMFSNAILIAYTLSFVIAGIFVLPAIMYQGNIPGAVVFFLVFVSIYMCVELLGLPYIISYFAAERKAGVVNKKVKIHVLLQLIPCVNIMDTLYLKVKNNNWSNKKKIIFSIITGLLIYVALFVFSLILLFIQGQIIG